MFSNGRSLADNDDYINNNLFIINSYKNIH